MWVYRGGGFSGKQIAGVLFLQMLKFVDPSGIPLSVECVGCLLQAECVPVCDFWLCLSSLGCVRNESELEDAVITA